MGSGSHFLSITQPLPSQEQTFPTVQEDYRTRFYEVYRQEAEEYDREFIKRYDEDMSTTLIFVGSFYTLQAWVG